MGVLGTEGEAYERPYSLQLLHRDVCNVWNSLRLLSHSCTQRVLQLPSSAARKRKSILHVTVQTY